MCMCQWVTGQALLMLADVLVRGQAAESMGGPKVGFRWDVMSSYRSFFSRTRARVCPNEMRDETIGERAPSRKASTLQYNAISNSKYHNASLHTMRPLRLRSHVRREGLSTSMALPPASQQHAPTTPMPYTHIQCEETNCSHQDHRCT
jgi:hypothetical protein